MSPEINMKQLSLITSTSAFTCGAIYLLGYWSMRFAFPQFWADINVRAQVVQEYPLLIQIWYFVVWILFGIAILVFNYGLLRIVRRQHGVAEGVITLACYVSACYLFTIGLIEILSAQSLLTSGRWLGDNPSESYQELYRLLIQLRASIEFSSDVWLLLVNLWLFAYGQLNKLITIFGMLVPVTGVLILTPAFAPYAELYIGGTIIWYFAIGTWLLKRHKSFK